MTFPIGSNGISAAAKFKQVLEADRHATTITYSSSGTGKQAFSDLVGYSEAFAHQPDTFTAQDIQAATGLDLNELTNPEDIEKLWDLDGNNRVDTVEMVTGLAHLDFADGEFDGKITLAGRQAVEGFFGRAQTDAFKARNREAFAATNAEILKATSQDEDGNPIAGLNLDDINAGLPAEILAKLPAFQPANEEAMLVTYADELVDDLHRTYQGHLRLVSKNANMRSTFEQYRQDNPFKPQT